MIYVIRLEDDHYFLMRNNVKDIKDTQLLFEAEIRYEYPKLHLPVYVHFQHQEKSGIDLDKYVKQYMLVYGIDNVRGGSYSSPVLPEYQKMALLDEMKTAYSQNKIEHSLDEIVDYANQPHTKEEVRKKLKELKFSYAKYQKEKELGIDFDVESVRKEIRWLETECESQLVNKKKTYIHALEKMDSIKRYRKLLIQLSHIRNMITNIFERRIQNVEIKHPEFVLDDFIYHQHRTHLPISIVKARNLCNEYQHFLNMIENRKAERDFDIASWGKDADIKMPTMIYLLEKLCRSSDYI